MLTSGMRWLLRLFVLVVVAAYPSFAENSLGGTIVDPINLPIPGAEIQIVHSKTKAIVFRTIASSNGTFGFANLPDGIYTLKINVSGFQTKTISNISMETGSFRAMGRILLKIDVRGLSL